MILALLAVFSINLLTIWHNSINDNDPSHAATVAHVGKPAQQSDPDGPIHVAAHAAGQWMIAPGLSAGLIPTPSIRPLWRAYDAALAPGRGPPAPMEPPRG